MQKTILHISLNEEVKHRAEKAALKQGFSLQEITRVFLTHLALDKVEIILQESTRLSSYNEERYATMTKDFKLDKNIYSVNNVQQLLNKLSED